MTKYLTTIIFSHVRYFLDIHPSASSFGFLAPVECVSKSCIVQRVFRARSTQIDDVLTYKYHTYTLYFIHRPPPILFPRQFIFKRGNDERKILFVRWAREDFLFAVLNCSWIICLRNSDIQNSRAKRNRREITDISKSFIKTNQCSWFPDF